MGSCTVDVRPMRGRCKVDNVCVEEENKNVVEEEKRSKTTFNSWEHSLENNQLVISSGFPKVN